MDSFQHGWGLRSSSSSHEVIDVECLDCEASVHSEKKVDDVDLAKQASAADFWQSMEYHKSPVPSAAAACPSDGTPARTAPLSAPDSRDKALAAAPHVARHFDANQTSRKSWEEDFAFDSACRPSKRACVSDGAGRVAARAPPTDSAEPPAWVRPTAPPVAKDHPLSLFLVTIDERVSTPPAGFARHSVSELAPVVDLYGVTREGSSVLLHVHGFLPYFFVHKPEGVPIEHCRNALDNLRPERGVVDTIEQTAKTPLTHFQELPTELLRISVTSQKLLATCRSAIEQGLRVGGGVLWRSPAFEGNVAFGLRFLVDVDMGGGGWVEVKGGRFQVRDRSSRTSSSQIEADAHWSALVPHKAEDQLAPLRLLTLHLRTVGPEARVVAGGALLQVHGESTPRHTAAWVIQSRERSQEPYSVPGAEVFSFSTEAACLAHMRDYIVGADVDILIGYDLKAHLAAAVTRADATSAARRTGYVLGRHLGTASHAKNSSFETKALGKHETKEVNVEGRLLFDVSTVLEREHKLTSYSLSAVALHFLDITRIELRAPAVLQLSKEDPIRLTQLALRDADLCAQIFAKLQLLFRYVEMARVTGVPMDYLLTRGQSVKVFSMLLRKARQRGFVLPPPVRAGTADESYEGGAVLEPAAGYYDEAVVTLDFASLYPSIMQRHNLCYSTLLPATAMKSMCSSSYEEVPTLGHCFVKASVRRGLIPMVLEELLAARATAKREMKLSQDPQRRAVLDGRQLALKISANSVYGFTGMTVGTLPCKEIAASVTAYGRQMIERTRQVIEERFCRQRGYEKDARVIYGDTDSVMVSLGRNCTLPFAFEFGKRAAEVVSGEFGAPVKMEFEKVYQPYLLMSKKRYAGLAWASPEKQGSLDVKGLEVVRRDWCPLVRQVVNRCLHLLLQERSPEQASAYVQETVALLRQNRVDPRLLVISKQLVREGAEAYSAKQAHVELAEKLRQRDPNSAPQIGERVSYVFTAAVAGTPAYDRAEDPAYAIEHEIPIDADYYVEHQLKSPLLRIFEPVLGSEGSNVVEQRLFAGDHARRNARGSHGAGRGPLAAFVQSRSRCLSCRSLLDSDRAAICANCAGQDCAGEVVLAQAAKLRALEEETSQLLAQCLHCAGPGVGHLHVGCANVDCPIFFRRVQVAKELTGAEAAMAKLKLDW